jgi:hypothetical protein
MAKLFRMYVGERADDNYVFSIVASDAIVQYVIPSDPTDYQSVFDSERIRNIIAGVDKDHLPKDPVGWAILASYNAGRDVNLFEVENAESEFMDLLVEDEQEYADAMAEKYKYLRDN